VYQRCARKEKDKKRKRQKSHLKKENLKGNDKKKGTDAFKQSSQIIFRKFKYVKCNL